MSTPERDPFDLLPQFADPEPDPVVMQAVIAQSREAFARRQTRRAAAEQGLWDRVCAWLSVSPVWLVPAGIGAFGVVVALAVVPGLMMTPPSGPALDHAVAEAPPAQPPAVSEPGPVLSRGDGIRMGAQPSPSGQLIEPDAAPMSIFDGDGVQLGYRVTPAEMLIYRLDTDTDTEGLVDSQPLVPGEQSDIRGAFVTSLGQPDLLVAQIRVDDSVFWRAYRLVDGAYARDSELSALLSDAPDQTEAKRRLAAIGSTPAADR
ncbi:hypothetical protein [Devosia sp. A369]